MGFEYSLLGVTYLLPGFALSGEVKGFLTLAKENPRDNYEFDVKELKLTKHGTNINNQN